MKRFVKLRGTLVCPAAAPHRVGRVAYDREQPGAAVARPRSAEPVEVLEGAQISVLNDVLRVVRVPHQVARQCVRGVQVRQHDGFEARELARLQPSLMDVAVRPSLPDPTDGGIIPGGIEPRSERSSRSNYTAFPFSRRKTAMNRAVAALQIPPGPGEPSSTRPARRPAGRPPRYRTRTGSIGRSRARNTTPLPPPG